MFFSSLQIFEVATCERINAVNSESASQEKRVKMLIFMLGQNNNMNTFLTKVGKEYLIKYTYKALYTKLKMKI